ncbi:hypothetical protein JD844_006856 [Phrynosoma platyrhinos]|uniref:Dual specificity protein phosphatase n=1 Tax=Phrynosoma platyrhinos TaxID=52577 RepID=A0ABQ7T3B1_PHRPL|nr:hypothetical protein JD844_006856 [Phrynosoma platyrhinos]
MKVSALSARQLRQLLRQEPSRCLVLDCRPYLSFSASSLRGSLNVNLNSVVLRRAHGGPVPLHFVEVKLLRRGYETFYSQYPEFCIDVKPISQEKTETERNSNGLGEKQCIQHKPAYDQGGPVEILPFLYLGSAYHASKCEFLANLNITALLNVSRKSSEPLTDQYCYKWIPVEDSHTADISSHFQEAIEFIDCTRRSGGKILVHCEAGISRSPTICMAYLMKMKKFRLEEAFDYIKQRRSLISPNFGFMGQLLQYESEILSSTPSPPVSSCKRDAVSFFAEELTRNTSFEGSCFAFPTSVLNSVPIHSPVHQLKLNPIAATSPCWTLLGTRDSTVL